MSTNLAEHIHQIRIIDTHEHLHREMKWVGEGPADVLADLFYAYIPADFIAAGADQHAVASLTDGSDPDVERRWVAVEQAWQAIRYTGYGEAVRIAAKELYNIDQITPSAIYGAQSKLESLRRPGQRLHLLREVARLDHVQIDDFLWSCVPDSSGPNFFFYDLSWNRFCSGDFDIAVLDEETGVTVRNLVTLRQSMEVLFEKYGSCAIAIKSQHAYNRTLCWEDRSNEDAERALQVWLADPKGRGEDARLCLGDWCWARGCELAAEYNLPFKLHTGYHAGNNAMPVQWIRTGNLCSLLTRYLDVKFVLMHAAYPYGDELIAITKHYSNVWADLCWAWSINPYSSMEFVQKFIHGAPINKLFGFGGDTFWPTAAYAYSLQARKWLGRALETQVSNGDLAEGEAMDVATRLLRGNQIECFDLSRM